MLSNENILDALSLIPGVGQKVRGAAKILSKVVKSSKSGPKIKFQKQMEHLKGTPQNINRAKAGKPTSHFYGDVAQMIFGHQQLSICPECPFLSVPCSVTKIISHQSRLKFTKNNTSMYN